MSPAKATQSIAHQTSVTLASTIVTKARKGRHEASPTLSELVALWIGRPQCVALDYRISPLQGLN